MKQNFQRSLALVLKHEGGFVNHPADPGGATNKGVTLATYRRYVKSNGTVADLKAITDAQISQVYKRHYWDAVHGDALPSGVDYAVFDFGVNSGPGRAVKSLQKVLMISQDGVIGPQTMAALSRALPSHVIDALCNERMRFLKSLPTWRTFGKGWTRRVDEVSLVGAALALSPPATSPATANDADGKSLFAMIADFLSRVFRKA